MDKKEILTKVLEKLQNSEKPEVDASTEIMDMVSVYVETEYNLQEVLKKDLVEAISAIKIEVPTPQVNVQPHVEIPKVDFTETNKLLTELKDELQKPCTITVKLELE